MKQFIAAMLLLAAGASMAGPTASPAPQAPESIDQAARRQQIEQQKAQAEQMNLPPAQTATDAPQILDMPVDHEDSPGASKK